MADAGHRRPGRLAARSHCPPRPRGSCSRVCVGSTRSCTRPSTPSPLRSVCSVRLGADGFRPIVAPLALCSAIRADGSAGHVLGDGSSLDPDLVIDVLEAIKPFVGLAGTTRGTWPIVPGVTLLAEAGSGGALVVVQRRPDDVAGRARTAAVRGRGDRRPDDPGQRPAASDCRACSPARRRTRPPTIARPCTPRWTAPTCGCSSARRRAATSRSTRTRPGSATLLAAGTELLLPIALDAVAAMTGGVTRARSPPRSVPPAVPSPSCTRPVAAPVRFDGQKLHDLADRPDGMARAGTSASSSPRAWRRSTRCSASCPARSAPSVGRQRLAVTVHGVVLTVQPQPAARQDRRSVTGLPVVDTVSASFGAGGSGVDEWSVRRRPGRVRHRRSGVASGRSQADVPAPGGRSDVGLALDGDSPTTDGHKELFARWRESDGLAVVARTRGRAPTPTSRPRPIPVEVALFAADAVLELLGNYIIAIDDVSDLLDKTVNGTSCASCCRGACSRRPMTTRWQRRRSATCRTTSSRSPAGSPARCRPFHSGPSRSVCISTATSSGLRLDVTDPVGGIVLNPGGDVQISIVTDSTWIEPPGRRSTRPGDRRRHREHHRRRGARGVDPPEDRGQRHRA